MNYSFDKQHAILYGVDEAIMLHNFIFWIEKNRANGKHFHDGRYWTYNSVEAFKSLFEFWTPKQLRRIIESLVDQSVIMRGNYNKSNIDRTGWYALVNEDALLGIADLPKRENAVAQTGEPIPYSKLTDEKHSSPNGDDIIVESDLFGNQPSKKEAQKKKLPAKKEKGVKSLLRDNTEITPDVIKQKIIGKLYSKANSEYYFECALSWSNRAENMAIDWVATITGFMLRDYKAGKLVMGEVSQEQKLQGIEELINNFDNI